MEAHSISAILFDLDDTLVDHKGAMRAGLDEWCIELGLPTGQYERFAQLERTWFAAFERGEISHIEQRVGRCREFLGKDLSEAEALSAYDGYLAGYRRNWRAFSDAKPALQRALDAGWRVGVLTNGARDMQWAKLHTTGLDLDGIVLIPTVEIGAPKPQPAAYSAGCAALDATPAQTLMVGDSPTNDVDGARAAGLTALLLDRTGRGDIASLDELDFS